MTNKADNPYELLALQLVLGLFGLVCLGAVAGLVYLCVQRPVVPLLLSPMLLFMALIFWLLWRARRWNDAHSDTPKR